jgi:hypothetical protein
VTAFVSRIHAPDDSSTLRGCLGTRRQAIVVSPPSPRVVVLAQRKSPGVHGNR